MKNTLYLLSALLVCAGCSTDRTVSRNWNWGQDTTALAYREGVSDAGGTMTTGTGGAVTGATDENMITVTIGQPATGQTSTGQIDQFGQGGTAITAQERVETGQAEIALRREELVVGKRMVSNGSVVLRKVVQTENVSQPVQLRREEYIVERIPASEVQLQELDNRAAANAFQSQEIIIPLLREQPVVGKRALLVERVQVGKRVEAEQQTVSQPVRIENVEVVKNVTDEGQGATAPITETGTIIGEQGAAETLPPAGEDTLRLAREELIVGKRETQYGNVLVRKVVQTQQASQPVELRHEEFVMNRERVADQPVINANFAEREVRVDLMREEPVVSTRGYVTEVVRIRKQVETDSQTVSGTIRRESIEVVQNTTGQTISGAEMLNRDQSGQGGQGGAAMMNRTETGQGGTGAFNQTSATMTGSSGMNTDLDAAGEEGMPGMIKSDRKPIPPPKGGEVLQFHDFDGEPTAHR